MKQIQTITIITAGICSICTSLLFLNRDIQVSSKINLIITITQHLQLALNSLICYKKIILTKVFILIVIKVTHILEIQTLILIFQFIYHPKEAKWMRIGIIITLMTHIKVTLALIANTIEIILVSIIILIEKMTKSEEIFQNN